MRVPAGWTVAAVAALAVASAPAQEATLRLRGTIAAIDGATLTIRPSGGADVTLRLAAGAAIVAARMASLADIAPGAFVGIASSGGDGHQDALEVQIVPEALRGGDEGRRPWDLGGASRMTGGKVTRKVEAYDGQDLTLAYSGGTSTIQVRPNTPVVALAPGTPADLVAGAAVFVRAAMRRPDGSIDAAAIVVGIDGARPAM